MKQHLLEKKALSEVCDANGIHRNADSGVFGLQAPDHVGKSIFVYGLSLKKLEKRFLAHELQVISIHIRRDFAID